MKKLFLLIILSTTLLISTGWSAELELKAQVEVTTSTIKLVDILTSAVDVPSAVLESDLGTSPALGQERIITRSVVENFIASWINPKEITWAGPVQCVVKRPSRLVSSNEVEELLYKRLKKATANTGEVTIYEITQDKPFYVPAGNLKTEVKLNPSVLQSSWSNATVRYMVEKETVLLRSFRFRWGWEREVWQANKAIDSGEALNPLDFDLVTRDTLALSAEAYTGDLNNTDLILSRSILPGSILTSKHVKERQLIKRGNPVVVKYCHNTISLTMKGTALADGGRGEVIPVRNESSRKKVLAKIVDEGVLEYVQ